MKNIKILIPILFLFVSSCYRTNDEVISKESGNESSFSNLESNTSSDISLESNESISSFSAETISDIDSQISISESTNINDTSSISSNSSFSSISTIEKKKYQIEYELSGGTNNSENPTILEEDESFVLKDATKEGYNFNGWYEDENFENEVVEIANLGSDIKLFAKWVNFVEDFISLAGNPSCAGLYIGNQETIIVPDNFTQIKLFGNEQNLNVKKLIISNNIISIDKSEASQSEAKPLYPNLEVIEVANLNNNFSSKSGILYSKDYKKLIFYPSNYNSVDFHPLNSVESIENYAFFGTNRLSKVYLGEENTGLISLGNYAFYDCQSLIELNIYKNLTSLTTASFAKCDEIVNINISDNNQYYYSPIDSNCIVDKTTNSIFIAFKNPVITSDVLTISRNAFKYTRCSKINIPSTLKVIPDYAFSANKYIEEVCIENGITSIGENAFNGCSNLQKINLPNTITALGKKCFSNTNIRSISIPGSIKQISSYCLSYCLRLREVIFEEGVESINDNAFYNCASLIKIYLPNSVKTIQRYAFGLCNNLSSIRLGTGLTVLDDYAFMSDFKLIEYINNSSLNIEYEYNEKVNDNFYGNYKNHIREVLDDYKNSKVSIEDDYALYRESSSISLIYYLGDEESVNIPNNVTRLCSGCFERYLNFKENSVRTIILGNSIQQIEKNTFIACNFLEKVVINGPVQEIPSGFIANFPNNIELVVPKTVTNIDANAFSNQTEVPLVTLSLIGNENDFSNLIAKINELNYSNISYQFVNN